MGCRDALGSDEPGGPAQAGSRYGAKEYEQGRQDDTGHDEAPELKSWINH
jgi:hypothetical protein